MIDLLAAGRALLLVSVANVVPWAAARAMPHRWTTPLDGGLRWRDGERLLGDHKTWRGFLLGTLACALVAALVGPGFAAGAGVGALSLTGDALSSALKRRLRLAPGTEIAGLDQLPEALLPLTVFASALGLASAEIIAATLVFLALDILVTRVRHAPAGRR
ncbi:MAG TPA: CDP-archaeol synthase [Steroidobacteraceae bacterium]|nr:CDP-archaeol synthase [Steroidobacteraceae bacterium]